MICPDTPRVPPTVVLPSIVAGPETRILLPTVADPDTSRLPAIRIDPDVSTNTRFDMDRLESSVVAPTTLSVPPITVLPSASTVNAPLLRFIVSGPFREPVNSSRVRIPATLSVQNPSWVDSDIT